MLELDQWEKILKDYDVYESWDEVMRAIENPIWRDWRNFSWQDHIRENLQSIWHDLPVQAQIMAYIMAQRISQENLNRE